ncbi:MAG: acetate kinase [Alteromonadaceae bacterium]|nr:MAG: acetate kinase [Alteromonadaceae bacterium]
MIPKILVVNCGSSSVKMSLFNHNCQTLVTGLAESLGDGNAKLSVSLPSPSDIQCQNQKIGKLIESKRKIEVDDFSALNKPGHAQAIDYFIQVLGNYYNLESELIAVGHRVVHGGEYFSNATQISADVLSKIQQCQHLAPLHNPANILGIELLQNMFPTVSQIAVFDTAFHQTLPPKAYTYGVPYEYYQQFGVRRYGFHGTSHKYVSREAVKCLNLDTKNHALICLHLGNGCSASAIRNGQCIDTTMGLTPLEGLLMGTRSGDIDPSIMAFLTKQLNIDAEGVNNILNKKSGLLGISGLSNDMRTLCDAAASGHQLAQLAIDVFCYRIVKTIGAFAVALGQLDAIVFTGGIGENAAIIRAKIICQLSFFAMQIDIQHNDNNGKHSRGLITTEGSPAALVIATKEEQMIAEESLTVIDSNKP